MAGVAREKSTSGNYHIIMRGINRQNIFEETEDYNKFIEIIEKYKEICGYQIYAYCLMSNHIHLLLLEGNEPLETIMRKINVSYVVWYNAKYDRVGNLFQDRYKSEVVEDDRYFLTVLRYIFQNPIKAGLSVNVENYEWTNLEDYTEENKKTYTQFVLDYFNLNRKKALKLFIEYLNESNNDLCLEVEDKRKITDTEAKEIIIESCKVGYCTELQKMDNNQRNECTKHLKEDLGLSVRQIERLTGISRGVIQRV